MSDGAREGPVVSAPQVMAAGLTSTAAAFLTSKFGVAGTLLGAALTAMIITGGSAILHSYLENLPGRVRTLAERRPELRQNFISRLRAALAWFSRLPPLRRRSVLIKGLIAATVAFLIGMGGVYGVEKGIGNSLSCGLWAECPTGATPGIHLGGRGARGASPTIDFGGAKTNTAAPHNGTQSPLQNTAAPQKGTHNPLQQQTTTTPNSLCSSRAPPHSLKREPVEPQTPSEPVRAGSEQQTSPQ